MTQNPQKILEKMFKLKNKWIERVEDSRMLFVIDSVSWKVYRYSYI